MKYRKWKMEKITWKYETWKMKKGNRRSKIVNGKWKMENGK